MVLRRGKLLKAGSCPFQMIPFIKVEGLEICPSKTGGSFDVPVFMPVGTCVENWKHIRHENLSQSHWVYKAPLPWPLQNSSTLLHPVGMYTRSPLLCCRLKHFLTALQKWTIQNIKYQCINSPVINVSQ